MQLIVRRLRRDLAGALLRLAPDERWRVLRWTVTAAVLEVLLRIWPLPRVARLMGAAFADAEAPAPVGETEGGGDARPLVTPAERRQLRTARRVARHWPFCAGTCLREALLAAHALRRHGPRLVIGVDRHDGAFAAHAWLEVGGAVVGDAGSYRRLV